MQNRQNWSQKTVTLYEKFANFFNKKENLDKECSLGLRNNKRHTRNS